MPTRLPLTLADLAAPQDLSMQEALEQVDLTPAPVRWLRRQGMQTMPIAGGPVGNPLDLLDSMAHPVPTTWQEAALTAAAAIPPGKVLGAIRGSVPETILNVSNAASRRPETAFAYRTQEYIPYVHAGHLADMVGAPFPNRQQFTDEVAAVFEGQGGNNVTHQALGLATVPKRRMTGLYEPPGAPIEVNPGVAIGVKVPVIRGGNVPDLYPDDRAALDAAAAIEGALTVQGGTPWNAQIRQRGGPGIFIPLDRELPQDKILAAANAKRPEVVIADTGAGVAVFPVPGGSPITAKEAETLAGLLEEPRYFRTQPVGSYVSYEDEWRSQPGTGAVTEKMLEHVGRLAAPQQENVSRALREPARRLSDLYQAAGDTRGSLLRQDVMNLLEILRTQGLDGLRSALRSGAFLPALGALSVPASVVDRQPSREAH